MNFGVANQHVFIRATLVCYETLYESANKMYTSYKLQSL